jgi:hypothetical protein
MNFERSVASVGKAQAACVGFETTARRLLPE